MSKTFGKYTIKSSLGEGGMGVVYMAHDSVLDRVVALKTIAPSFAANAQAKERLLREARAAAKLQHPNIVSTYELGDVDGQLFIAMEYLQGRNLEQTMGDSLETARLVEIMLQTCRALDYAHQHGVVHRDVKPSNIHISPDGHVKLLDFGIAHLENSDLTQTGTHLGTPEYMSPEMVEGDDLDQRSDVFSCGVVFYEMISAKKPFKHERITTTLFNILSVNPPPLRQVAPGTPPELERIVAGMIVKDRDKRYQDLGKVITDLEGIQARSLLSKTDKIKEMQSELEGLTEGLVTASDDPSAAALLRERFSEAVEAREESVGHLSRASDSAVTETRIQQEIDRLRSLRQRVEEYRSGGLEDDLERSQAGTQVFSREMIEAAAAREAESPPSKPTMAPERLTQELAATDEVPPPTPTSFPRKALLAGGVAIIVTLVVLLAASIPWSNPPLDAPPGIEVDEPAEIPLETQLESAYRAEDATRVSRLIADLEQQGPLSASQNFLKGWSLCRLKRFQAAVSPLRASLGQDPSNRSAQVFLGQALWESTHRNEPARRHLLDALRVGSASPAERAIIRDCLLAMRHRFKVRHTHGRRFGIVGSRRFCPGTLAFSGDSLEFKSESQPRHDFQLALDQVGAIELGQAWLRVLKGNDRHSFEWVDPGSGQLLRALLTQVHGFKRSPIEDGTRLEPK